MKLSDILTDSLIQTTLEAEDRIEAIEELVDLLITEHELSLRDRDGILKVVIQREMQVSTGVGGGVAIPHGTVDCIYEIVGAIGISKRGINFEAVDNAPVTIVVLLLVPKTQITMHIKTMAQVARIFHRKSVRESIRNASSPDQALKLIRRAETDLGD